MSNWQPIETAPRDGTQVDLWASHREVAHTPDLVCKEVATDRYVNAYWDTWRPNSSSGLLTERSGWRTSDDEGGIETERWRGMTVVTHWMPLPAPPEPAEA